MGAPVPRLRTGVSLRLGASGVEVTDASSGKRYLLEAALYPALSRINGKRDVDALLDEAARRGGRASTPAPAEVEKAVAALERLGLLEKRDVAARPLLFPLPYGFTCQGSGQCCRRFLVGPLSEEDRAHIDGVDWRARGYADVPSDPYVSGPDGKYLKKRADGYCVFYGPDGLCDIHRELGGQKKPLVCRMFPFEPLEEARGIRVLLRLECSVLARAIPLGAPLAAQEGLLA